MHLCDDAKDLPGIKLCMTSSMSRRLHHRMLTCLMALQDSKVEDNLVPRPKLVSLLEGLGVDTISAGKAHTLALTHKGLVYSFGLQTYGRLGRKDADTTSDKPLGPGLVEISEEDSVVALAAGK